ncbi:hypothetical protein V0U79_12830 [Hyphobacterium sp. HN65]|uniref:Uncharacterized protein n=1 Tax=Hyphobacterium lacteum TaxID=3116575 RepID=A0ABU7LUM2_9PROT|nr:hypothetical protein [Hyphobacterium sp. HN65]MEE2527244.1 hypothetical protein [Hyphobacterium sp. HN65]
MTGKPAINWQLSVLLEKRFRVSVSIDGLSHPLDTAACVSLSNIHDVKQTDRSTSVSLSGSPLGSVSWARPGEERGIYAPLSKVSTNFFQKLAATAV